VKRIFSLFATLLAFAAVAAAATAPAIPWKEPEYTLVARDMDLRTALDAFAIAEGLSVVMSDSVQGRFSGDFRDVPAGEFLERLAAAHNFTWYYDGAALYLYSAGEIQTLLLDLQYMKAGEVRQVLRDLGVEDGRFPIRTASNDELILVSGPPRYVGIVAETIAKADKLREMRTFNEVEVRMFPLRHTWAEDVSFRASSPEGTLSIKGVAGILSEMMAEIADSSHTIDSIASAPGSEGGTTNPPAATAAPAFRPVIRSETRLNAIIVRDVKSRMPMYEELIRQLDVPQRLVEIAVTVVELSRDDALDWQLSLSFADGRKDTDFSVGQNAGNLFSSEELAGMGLAGTLTHIHSSYQLGLSLTALRQNGKARSVSRTTLLTVNNLAAQMSDSQSYHARVIGNEVANLEEVSAGTDLQIKPRIISPEEGEDANSLWLSISLSDGGFETVTVDSMPMTRSSTLQTQTAIREDSSIMLAGYLRDIESKAGWGIPFLRDIPLIGWLFGGVSTSTETVQRMFIITPHIIDLDLENPYELETLQATRLRDITVGEEIEDASDESDELREERKLERKSRERRRKADAKAHLERRKAELLHEEALHDLDRRLEDAEFEEDRRDWTDEERSRSREVEGTRRAILERARAMAEADALALQEEARAAELRAEAAEAAEEAREEAREAAEEAEEAAEKALEAEKEAAEEAEKARKAAEKEAEERAKALEEANRKAAEEARLAEEKAIQEAIEAAERETKAHEEAVAAEQEAARKALEEEREAAEKARKEAQKLAKREAKARAKAQKEAQKAAERVLKAEKKAAEREAKAARKAHKEAQKAAERVMQAEKEAAEREAKARAKELEARREASEDAEKARQESEEALDAAKKALDAALAGQPDGSEEAGEVAVPAAEVASVPVPGKDAE